MSSLALFGGKPVREKPFPPHPVIEEEEKRAVVEVLESGELSSFIAAPGKHFLGGKKVKEFERRFAEYHGVEYAVAFNSATAALHAAVVAVGVEPGQEVIVPPYTFTSTATSVLMHNAVPVFADVEADIFCLDPEAAAQSVSPLTRAMIPVHLFGHPAEMDGLMEVARGRGLKVIEDCAQAPGALHRGRPVGTIGDCGIFSFTENKTMATGEGGMLITRDKAIAEAARMVRNHGETVWEGQRERTYTSTMLGWNYRMTELEAALGIVQFSRLDELNRVRVELCSYLTQKLSGIEGLEPPVVKAGSTHVYYVYALKYDEETVGVPRGRFVEALGAEGVPFGAGYVKPLYLSPIYHESKPFAFEHYKGSASYSKGLCPVTEELHERSLITTIVARPPATRADMDDIVRAFHKVLDRREELVDKSIA